MKKSITLAALLLVLGTSVFAAVPTAKIHKSSDEVSFVPLSTEKGFAVKISKQEPGKSLVMIYDQDKNVIFKDVLTKGTEAEKGYILTSLDNGDYTVEVTSNKQAVKKHVHVYEEDQKKSYIFID
jgi:hypothetical protein